MFKVFLVLVLAIMCNGCATSAVKHSLLSKSSSPAKSADKRLVRYASAQGCSMMPNGYMVCPK